ncbi:MAG: chain length determinant protein EpsF, partial [Betaproteobacteria bacterium]
VLAKEVDNAQKAFDVASQRFQTTKLESQTSLTNISVLSPALPPSEPSSPLLLLNTLLALVVGAVVGIAMALLVETLNRRVRSAAGLREALGAPVLASLLDDRPVRLRVRRLGFAGPGSGLLKPAADPRLK